MTKIKAQLTEGPIFFKLLAFTVPIILTSLLQTAYNIADTVVVGQFSGDELAIAAIGATASLTTLFIGVMVGLSTGSGILIARRYGSGDGEGVSRALHTSMLFSVIVGVAVATLALVFSEAVVTLMGTRAEYFDRAVLYFRWIAVGMPFTAIYNFGASALRSVGDSKTPLLILGISGLLNVGLNIVFVLCFNMTVDGVAIATSVSKLVSAIWVVLVLVSRRRECYCLKMNSLKIHKESLFEMLYLGIPTALQSALFSFANVIITGSVNSLSPASMSAKTIQEQIMNLPGSALNSFTPALATFTAQNHGAMKPERIKRGILYSLLQTTVIGLLAGLLIRSILPFLVGMFVAEDSSIREEIFATVTSVLSWYSLTFFLLGVMNALSGALRGLGRSLTSMFISLISVFGIRIVWTAFIFPLEEFHSLAGLYICFPVSWLFCTVFMGIFTIIAYRKIFKKRLDSDTPKEYING